jgi:RHS repeat-associated protein
MTEQFTYQGPFLIRSTCGPREGAAIVQTFAYGGPGARLSEETSAQDGFTARVGYGYDDRGRLESLTYPSGRTVHYGYDDLNRIASVAQNGSPVATVPPGVGYDPWQNLQTLVFGSGAQDQWLRDASGVRLAQWNLFTAGPEAAQVRKYAYDPAGRLVQAGEWTQLGYDLNDRLVSAEGYGVQQSLAYDAYDNNVSSVVAGDVPAGRVNFTFLPQIDNRFPNKTATGGLVDGAQNVHGEMLRLPDAVGAGPALTLGWDGLGHLVEAGPGDGNSKVSYQYSAAGRRVVRRDHGDPGRDRGYVYASNGLLLSEFAPAPGTSSLQWQRDVVYLDRQAIAEVDGQGVHELHSDHLGSPRVVTAGADGMAVAKGHTEGTQTFGPYGERWAGSQTGYTPLTGYTGHLQTEPNNLIYMKGRFYSPTWHRFLNSDQGVDEKSLNPFAYVRGNPLMETDPTGLVDGGMNSRDAAQHETAHHATLEAERAIERGERSEALERFEREQEVMEHWTGSTLRMPQTGLYPVHVWDYTPHWGPIPTGVPHTFIQTPNMARGYYPKADYHFFSAVVTVPGEVRDDTNHRRNNSPTQTFWVDAATLSRVEQGMSWSPRFYELNNGFWEMLLGSDTKYFVRLTPRRRFLLRINVVAIINSASMELYILSTLITNV